MSNGILLSHKRELNNMPFAATRIDLEMIILNEISQIVKNIIWYHLYVESKNKEDTNELICRTETDLQILKIKLVYHSEWGGGAGGGTGGLGLAHAHWGIRIDWATGFCCIAQGTLSTQYSLIIYVGNRWVCMYDGIT